MPSRNLSADKILERLHELDAELGALETRIGTTEPSPRASLRGRIAELRRRRRVLAGRLGKVPASGSSSWLARRGHAREELLLLTAGVTEVREELEASERDDPALPPRSDPAPEDGQEERR